MIGYDLPHLAAGTDATVFAAWVGALTGCASLGWKIFEWFHQGARLKVSVTSHMVYAPGVDKRRRIAIWVDNVGNQPTTLTNVTVHGYKRSIDRWLSRASTAFLIPNPSARQPLPLILQPGHRWFGEILQDAFLEGAQAEGWTGRFYVAVHHGASKKPIRTALDFVQ